MVAFNRVSIDDKLRYLESDFLVIKAGAKVYVPDLPGRDIEILPARQHPPKKGLSTPEGQARLLHDLASIELQAMELGLRTLVEFPGAPQEFRDELIELTRSEGRHLKLCLEGLKLLGFKWGQWPVHCMLWMATSAEDSLLDRLLIVHRYLEGSGLDAGEQFLKRFKAIQAPTALPIVKTITEEEVGHVKFGSDWYHSLCEFENLDPEKDFPERMWKIREFVPKRIEKISRDLRKKAGFTDFEIKICEDIRDSFI